MSTLTMAGLEALAREVRLYVFGQVASTARVPQARQIAEALQRAEEEIHEALQHFAAGKVLILATNDGNIWAANPFCAVPSGFRVESGGNSSIDRATCFCRNRHASPAFSESLRLALAYL